MRGYATSTATRMADGLGAVNEPICVAARNSAGVLMMVMTVIVLVQIVFRYVMNDSLIWTEEVAKTLMVWTAFLVAPWAYRHSANVSIDMFAEELPERLRRGFMLVLNLLVIWIVIVFWQESFGMVERGLSIRAASLPLPVAWFYAVVPVSFAAMLLVGIELALRDLLGLLYPDRDFSIPDAGVPMEGE